MMAEKGWNKGKTWPKSRVVILDYAEEPHGAKGLAPSNGENMCISLHFGGRQSFAAA